MNQPLRRSRSHCSVDKLTTERLLCYRWAEMNSLVYLNIIDYQGKMKYSETIPWSNVPSTDEEIRKYSQISVYMAYQPYILDKIAVADNILVSQLIRGMLHVSNLYSVVFDSDRKTLFYVDIIHRLFEKKFDDPASFLNLWNLLCGNSNETKINVLSSLVERRHDKKSAIILSYILNIAQAAQFNFWGMWFKENEEDVLCFCPVTVALLKGNVDHLVMLLQYGFEQNPGRVAIYDKYFHHIHNPVYSWLKAPLEERNPGRNAVVTEVLLFLIQISKIKSKSKLKSLAKCFGLLWSLNAVPFVTESELVDEIYRRFQSPPRRLRYRSFPYTCRQFLNLVEYYDQVKPQGSTEDIHPRSLQQFCKCRIRKTLVRSYNLPQGIKKLPLPKKLQEFLDV
ncbi:hypothetical protein AVEN_89301-1 [Araneus ventricosus]|uniref:SOCS box domain-containing protein n=1 Tax=Araneus ventricosus TaxID=182803 RepID=A0A4Y2K8E2_ARAVE|nr:hypothetical protein AVEN_89301-1 [Araneus ventricosus]